MAVLRSVPPAPLPVDDRARHVPMDLRLTGRVDEPHRWCARLMALAGDAWAFRSLEDAVPHDDGRVDVYLSTDFDGEDVLVEAAGACARLELGFPRGARLVWLPPEGGERPLWQDSAAA